MLASYECTAYVSYMIIRSGGLELIPAPILLLNPLVIFCLLFQPLYTNVCHNCGGTFRFKLKLQPNSFLESEGKIEGVDLSPREY